MKKLLSMIMTCLGLVACSERLLTPVQFTKEYASELSHALSTSKIEIVADLELRVRDRDGNERTTFLNNCYLEYQLNPKDKKATIAKYVAALIEPRVGTGKIDTNHITPVVKDKAWISEIQETMRVRGAEKAPENVYDELNRELLIVYAEDSPKSLRYLLPKEIEEAGLKKEDLRDLAVKNLRALLPKIEIHGKNGLYMVTAGGDYEASLLLLDEVWTDGRMTVNGDYVVAIPSRDLLLVCGSRDADVISKMRQIAKKAVTESPYHLTADLFIYEHGRFVRFE